MPAMAVWMAWENVGWARMSSVRLLVLVSGMTGGNLVCGRAKGEDATAETPRAQRVQAISHKRSVLSRKAYITRNTQRYAEVLPLRPGGLPLRSLRRLYEAGRQDPQRNREFSHQLKHAILLANFRPISLNGEDVGDPSRNHIPSLRRFAAGHLMAASF